MKLRVKHTQEGFRVGAVEDGQEVGYVNAVVFVGYVEVDASGVDHDHRRRGIGRAIYRRAAEVACKKYGNPLTSATDEYRSPEANIFWRAEMKQGAAKQDEDGNFYYPCVRRKRGTIRG